jgi:hypothetical protein
MRPPQLRLIFLLLPLCVIVQLMLHKAVAQVPDDLRASLTARGHALLIGVSTYNSNSWPQLTAVFDDIESLAQGLAPHFESIETLINPTTDEIRFRLREFMTRQSNQTAERLLVYYAGHGFTDYNPNIRTYTGYITGKDTPACHGGDCGSSIEHAIPFQELDALNRVARARQVIMLFDSCFSGSVFLTRSTDNDPLHYDYDRARDALHNPVRYYITAGAANEQIPANSPFAQLLLRGLRGEADIYKDGFITGEQLGAYLQRNLPVYSGMSLHPQKGTIAEARLSVGEFIFLTSLSPFGDLAKLTEQVRSLSKLRHELEHRLLEPSHWRRWNSAIKGGLDASRRSK